jgi:hypothetical protein
MISGVNKLTSYRALLKDYNIVTVVTLYILKVICYIKH